jgi:MoxR-like ATPase
MIMKCQEAVRAVQVPSAVCDHILERVHQTREHPALLLGASPRGSLGLFRAGQAMAAIRGESSVSASQVDELLEVVLIHRLIVRSERKTEGVDACHIVREILTGTKRVPAEGLARTSPEQSSGDGRA